MSVCVYDSRSYVPPGLPYFCTHSLTLFNLGLERLTDHGLSSLAAAGCGPLLQSLSLDREHKKSPLLQFTVGGLFLSHICLFVYSLSSQYCFHHVGQGWLLSLTMESPPSGVLGVVFN